MNDDTLGLAIGTTNLTAVRPGREAVSRRAVLTLWEGRPAEVGVPSQNPELTSPNLTAPGVVLRGFVERVGDPVPLVAQDGSTHRGEVLTVTALEAMARTVDDGRPMGAVVVAVPAHWGPATVGALRGALRSSQILSPGGVAPLIVSDASAALAALRSDPGLPTRGVVALCDFGAGGSSITLTDAAADFAIIGETIRYADFSGDHADQALLDHVLSGIQSASPAETGGTAAVGSLMRLREECRLAKERLSAETTAVVPADLPGFRSDIRITRAELENLLSEPFIGFLDALGDALERNGIPAANLAAVATVGGSAAIPLVTQRLSEQLRVPVVTTAQPGLIAARGAAVIAATGADPQARTGMSAIAADAPTSLAPSAWAVGAAGQAATESAADGSPSATFRALAWSQDDPAAGEPVPYTGGDYQEPAPYTGAGYQGTDYPGADDTGSGYTGSGYIPPMTDGRPAIEFGPGREPATDLVPAALPWYRRPPLLFGIAAVLATMAVGGLAVTLTTDSSPTTTTTRVTKPGEDPGTPSPVPPPSPQTVTVTGNNGQTTVTTVTPTTTASTAPSSTTTPTTTTTTTPTTTTTTTTTTTPTTTTTTTTPTTTRTTVTTTQPPTTTTAEPTTTVAPQPTTTVAPQPTTTVAPQPTTVEPVVTTEVLVPTLKPAPEE